MRLYFSTEPRQYEAAWLQLGDPFTLLSGQTIGDGLTEFSFECDSSCSSYALLGKSVTVIGESLHMHQTGTRMTNQVIRNGEVVNEARVDVFEFDQQGSFKVPQAQYQIQSGDSFRTTCYYRDGTEFGLSSSEEMCVAFVLYYPAKQLNFGSFGSIPWFCSVGIDSLPVCKEEMQVTSLSSDEELGRAFGTPPSQCLVMPSTADDSDGTDTDIDGNEEITESNSPQSGESDTNGTAIDDEEEIEESNSPQVSNADSPSSASTSSIMICSVFLILLGAHFWSF